MKNGINVLSCFDGLAGGLVALKRAGIKVNKYYAFEIDKYAIKIATKNHSEIIELGDINNWKFFDEIEIPDLIIAGSPCQGFSVAGQGLNFEDPRSKLFFVFVDILNYWKQRNPKLKFMLENVKMKAGWRDIITSYLGVEPVLVNSALVSAQNRQRYYWANWQFPQPEDRGLVLRDVLEDNDGTPVIKNRGTYTIKDKKAMCLDANYHKGSDNHGQRTGIILKTIPHGYIEEKEEEVEKYPSLCAQSPESKHLVKVNRILEIGKVNSDSKFELTNRVYSVNGKPPTLVSSVGGSKQPKIAENEYHYRKLTPLECERLQTLDDGYTNGVSNTQRYRMIGNGWTIEVVCHIFSFLPKELYPV